MPKYWDEHRDMAIIACEEARSMSDFLDRLAPLVGERVTYDQIQKAWQRWRIMDPSMQSIGQTLGSGYVEQRELGRTELDLHKAEEKLKLERKRAQRALRELDRTKRKLEAMLEMTMDIEPIKIIEKHPNVPREAVAITLASDWHIEEMIDPAKVSGRNEYNPDIAKARAERYFRALAWMVDHAANGYQIDTLIVALTGDLISGYIHEDLMESNAMSPSQASIYCQEIIAGGIKYLLSKIPQDIKMVCCYGNHGRTTKKAMVHTAAENSYEWMMYQILKSRFAEEPRVQFVIGEGDLVHVDVFDWVVRFHHGHNINYGGGVGGLSIPLRKAIDAWNELHHADLTCIGHWHTYQDFSDSVINGSLIGYSPYSVKIKARYEPPKQAFFLMDKRRGKVQVSPIWVE